MLSFLFGSLLATAAAQRCGDILYYGRLIEEIRRTGRTTYGMVNDQTGLAEYEAGFGPGFAAALARLGPTETWINFGAGRAIAEREFLAQRGPDPAPRVVSVSAYPAPAENPYPERHVLRFGQLMEEMDWSNEPKAQVGSDRFGPLSYASRFDVALTIEGEALEPGAPLYVMLQRDRTLFREHGRDLPLNDLLQRVGGLKIVHPVALVPGQTHLQWFVLERTEGPVTVPAMHLSELKMMLPPYRVFEL